MLPNNTGELNDDYSYELEDEQLILNLFGKTLIERWAFTKEMYSANLPNARLKLYPKVGYEVTKEMWDDLKAFFIQHL